MNKELLKNLCMLCGVSGDENKVRDFIISQIKDSGAKIDVDNMGNLLVFKKGKKTPNKKLLLSAHMDEVGFMVTYITDDGFIKFNEVGGIDRRVVLGKAVTIGDRNINGVVCVKPIHLTSSEEREKIPDFSEMYIDIGASSKEEAEKVVSLGDSISFAPIFKWENNVIMGKALDDRAGCFILIEMINSDLLYDMYFSFVVQEEVGLRGSKCAAYAVDPDYAIVVEATTAADVPEVADSKTVCNVGGGAVVSVMDKRTIYNKDLVKTALKAAEKRRVKAQLKKAVAGGNDAGAIHCSRNGVKTAAISLPCRYLHSNCGLISEEDLVSVKETVAALSEMILSEV